LARKILLADDSVTAQNMGRKILADAGYDVITVNNGSAALKRIAESTPDLIILDVYMPGYSGLEVCQRLKDAEETAHIPVLLSVGKLEPFKPQEARRVRADAHIVKPFEASQLLTAIARLEDQMVPQQKGSHRFATSGAATMDDPFTRPDESRTLGRSAKTKKQNQNKDASSSERPDPSVNGEDNQLSPQAASFRDFRKKAKSQAATSSPADYSSDNATESVSHEPGPLAKLPGDITAEELSALSEVAAQLNEARPAAESVPSSHQSTPFSGDGLPERFAVMSIATPAEIAASQLEDEVARLPVVEAPISAAPVSVAAETFVAARDSEDHKTESTESIEPARPAVKAWEVSAVAKNEIEIPAAELEPANHEITASAQRGQIESSQVEASQVQSQTAESSQDPQHSDDARLTDAVSMASFPQEPAPVDQQDEPMFAAARSVEAYAEEIAQQGEAYVSSASAPTCEQSVANVNVDDKKKEELASVDASFAHAVFGESTSAESASAQSASTESTTAQATSAESSSVEVPASESTSAEAVAAIAPATAEALEPEAPMPSDAELAEALRMLTPTTPQAEAAPQLAETISATRPWSDNEETMEISAGKRWVAEALELTPEESAMSLEAEMFRSFAANAEKIEALPVDNPLAAIQLAVENRLAAEAAAAAEAAGEAAPKAMAATAPAGVASAASAESDIASIVEKVMADLRPKIVEEIARKLSGK
jgi:CheY-like chemotaxis protein